MNISKISEITTAGRVDEFPESQFAEFAFWGRSNVGKSSLLNNLVNNKSVAKVSKNPGKTRRIHFFEVSASDDFVFSLVDMPGYGYAKVSKDKRVVWEKLMADYVLQREQLQTLFLLIDASIPPQKVDLEMVEKLIFSKIPFALVFTKTDKQKEKENQKTISIYKQILDKQPVFETSILSKKGIFEIDNFILESLKNL